jgi:hypothetical protein
MVQTEKFMKNGNVFLTVLEAGKSKIKVLASDEGLLAASEMVKEKTNSLPGVLS